MLVRIGKTAVVALAVTALAWALMLGRHPLLRYAAAQALEQDVARARGGDRP